MLGAVPRLQSKIEELKKSKPGQDQRERLKEVQALWKVRRDIALLLKDGPKR